MSIAVTPRLRPSPAWRENQRHRGLIGGGTSCRNRRARRARETGRTARGAGDSSRVLAASARTARACIGAPEDREERGPCEASMMKTRRLTASRTATDWNQAECEQARHGASVRQCMSDDLQARVGPRHPLRPDSPPKRSTWVVAAGCGAGPPSPGACSRRRTSRRSSRSTVRWASRSGRRARIGNTARVVELPVPSPGRWCAAGTRRCPRSPRWSSTSRSGRRQLRSCSSSSKKTVFGRGVDLDDDATRAS